MCFSKVPSTSLKYQSFVLLLLVLVLVQSLGTTRLPYEPFKKTEIGFLSSSQNLTKDGNRLRFFMTIDYVTSGSLNVGDYITARGYFTQFFSASNSASISYIDVTILSCGGYGFFAYGGDGGHIYRRVRITYAPPPVAGGAPPLITCSADGIHNLATRKGPTVQNSLVEGTQDDAITMTGSRGDVTGVFGGGQFQITYGFDYSIGDILRIYTSSYTPRGYVTVSSVHQRVDQSMNITVTGDIINSIQVTDIVADISHGCNGFLLENNLVRWHRARGMLIKASNGIIRNNILNGSSIGGIHITPEYNFEADYSQNLTVEGNIVSDSGFFYYGYGSICIFEPHLSGGGYAVSGGFINIIINNNTIFRSYRDNILITSTLNVTVTNNRIVGPLYNSAVNLINIDNITLVDNVVYQADPKNTTLLHISNVIHPQNNLTAGVYFNQTSIIPTLPDWPGFI